MSGNKKDEKTTDKEALKKTSAIARAAESRGDAGLDGDDGDADHGLEAEELEAAEPSPDSALKRRRQEKSRRNRKKTIILYILLCICIAAVIVCAVGLGVELYTERVSIKYYTELSADVEKRPSIRPIVTGAPAQESARPGLPERPPDAGNDDPVMEEATWVPYVDFEALSERFPGIVGWIVLEGTLLDYPVMQGTDNYYYLSYLPDGTRNRAGSVFLDYRNSPDFTDRNSLIYGHMSKVGEMFGALKNYRTQSFYEAHPYINLYTPEHDYRIVLVAGYLVDSGVEVPPLSFRDDAAFERYIANIKSRSVFRSDVTVSNTDRLVCLCTCAYDFTNARLVIVGKLVEATWSANPNLLTQ